MNDRNIADTNIWFYSVLEKETLKGKKAINILSRPDIVLSTQIINELCFNLKRKGGYDEEDIEQFIHKLYSVFPVYTLGEEEIKKASFLRKGFSLSFWDSLIVAVAVNAECRYLYSEDMQHNLTIERTTIINPFL